ncbi:hypothetical protein [Empedobacter sp. UBA7494]|uniref:hypothetical protein n=1 Tax=Empedobacter sp. UBA7494 TaxID=1946450 RepID=UPI0025C52E27|nr:hypothetical protein [Empedobacter sp. UBA7494]
MNFDELQKQWDNQSSDEVKIDPNLEFNQEANTIIDKVRKTLKKEFYYQLSGLIFLFFMPFLFDANSQLVWWVLLCVSATFLVPFYYIFNFYKRSYHLEYNSLKNINWFYYNYKSSIDIYSIYSYIIYILVLMLIGISYMQNDKFLKFENEFYFFLYVFLTLLAYSVVCVWMLKWWIKKFYKKNLEELENILHQLEE